MIIADAFNISSLKNLPENRESISLTEISAPDDLSITDLYIALTGIIIIKKMISETAE